MPAFRPENHPLLCNSDPLLSVDTCPKCGKQEVSLPAYPGDYFDCDVCGHSWSPTKEQIEMMWNYDNTTDNDIPDDIV
jgi:hypothetical protein